MFIDTHAHLTDEIYGGSTEIIQQMAADNLSKIITVGYDLESSTEGVRIAEQHSNIYAAVGIHPSDAMNADEQTYAVIAQLLEHKKTVALGEIGLDYHYDDTDKPAQRRVFLQQLKCAHLAKKPVILHVRDAYGDVLQLLQENSHLLDVGGVLHCYSGSEEMISEFLKLNLHISFSGSVTFKNNKKADGCIARVPKDRILTETDCPYLTPMPYRGQVNYPKYVSYVAEKVAAVYGCEVRELCDAVALNCRKLFGI